MRDFALTVEPFAQMWEEARPLAEAHFREVEEGVEPRRRFDLDLGLMNKLEEVGSLFVLVARNAVGVLIGYYTWQISLDVESLGLVIAQQGAWYLAPGHPRVARAMFTRSCTELRQRGVQCIFPHHRLQGRGQSLGRFFLRQGAKPTQVTYSLWIGEGDSQDA